MARYEVEAIGWVRGGRAQVEDDEWGQSRARIELDQARFGSDALAGLDAFSHAEILFLFHQATKVETGARHPRGRADWPAVGIFAQRGKDRPNHIGASICRILSVVGTTVEIAGLDAIDGTPVLDIKPVMSGFLPQEEIREPLWSKQIMASYW